MASVTVNADTTVIAAPGTGKTLVILEVDMTNADGTNSDYMKFYNAPNGTKTGNPIDQTQCTKDGGGKRTMWHEYEMGDNVGLLGSSSQSNIYVNVRYYIKGGTNP